MSQVKVQKARVRNEATGEVHDITITPELRQQLALVRKAIVGSYVFNSFSSLCFKNCATSPSNPKLSETETQCMAKCSLRAVEVADLLVRVIARRRKEEQQQ